MRFQTKSPNTAQRGFTLVELMIASTLGLLILAGLTTLFVNNTSAQAEVEKSSRQIENGRFATQLLTGDLRNAGYYGALDATVIAAPTALPDPCSPPATAASLADNLPLPVQGYDDVDATALSGCLSDVRALTDIIVTRHTSTCALGDANCDPASAGGPFLQASLCSNNSELGSALSTDFYAFALTSTDSALSRHDHTCNSAAGTGAAAPIRRFETYIYFIANNDNPGDGIPTLKRAELGVSGTALQMSTVPLVEGIENMQIQYGVGNGTFFDAPTDVAAWEIDPTTSARINVLKLSLLARNTVATPSYTNSNTYTLGNKSVTINGDHFKRHVFEATIFLPNRQ
jgi:type IV pilus assembly protein PilW